MKPKLSWIMHIRCVLFAIGMAAPCALRAQAVEVATATTLDFHVDITLFVPVQVKDFDPTLRFVLLRCRIRPAGPTGLSSPEVYQDSLDAGALENGVFNGTLHSHFAVQAHLRDQWSYRCDTLLSISRNAHANGNVFPGSSGAGVLTSGTNLVTGTFTIQ